ncbi:hypothetical protein EHQ12_02210 [Leptospira gomenensis]|uniref:Lipoprotein n=1 Tax=Leptospira gomenensis TaxID=2484974 RepID=A0A5F1YIN3_9LEPT|nr:hypothetical protein [Leptospira gomenensis]TGK31536.1 hypothetical protein EHQ17_14105 [Leptospira gomenensis]TGK44186.1 hypothetical protein EHQ12_02210 [Leptospira gomenensis]TGK46241.1 hypothetical protein EHQ07_07340 [Leptospira gomenensis]TGK54766.1 hypothetical protein EHQ13_18930 [Leptospira gomenensis]
MKSFLSLFLSVSVLFQGIVFSSGLFGCVLSEKAKICECNHGSRLQKHSNGEDARYFDKTLAGATSTQTGQLPDCHSAKKGETHTCACKKAENKLSQLRAFYSAWSSPLPVSYPEPISEIHCILSLEYSNTGILLSRIPFEPPRFS